MSQIFDALQRSEGERSGNTGALPAQATDMLRRAERQASSKWENESLGGPESVAVAEFEEVRGHRNFDSLASALTSAASGDSIRVDDRQRVLDQFQVLQPTVTPESRLVSLTEQDSPAAEAFRLLGVRLRDLSRTRPLKKILVTSTIPQEGKTTVAANLA